MEYSTNKLIDILPLIKYPLLTEKSYLLLTKNKYSFIVDRKLTKNELKEFFTTIFQVEVKKINTLLMAPKRKRIGKFTGKRPVYKKVIITLKSGYEIKNIFNIN